MSGFHLANLEPDSSEAKIYEDMRALFDQNGRLLVLLDETLEPGSFSEIKFFFKEENIVYLPLALGNKPTDTNLFFAEINTKEILEKVGRVISGKILHNSEITNNKYVVHGFGTSLLENDQINSRFKKSLVVQDINSKILFRWYDPRVLIHLDQIFNEIELHGLLGIFETWHFIHPTGYFSWKKDKNKKFISRKIYELSYDQSIALDLIEISNLVFVEAYNYDEIDRDKLDPKNVLLNLYVAHENYKIHKYSDLFSYGLYAEILGQHFFIHPEIQIILKDYWMTSTHEYDFNEAINFLDRDKWISIKKELNNLEGISHG